MSVCVTAMQLTALDTRRRSQSFTREMRLLYSSVIRWVLSLRELVLNTYFSFLEIAAVEDLVFLLCCMQLISLHLWLVGSRFGHGSNSSSGLLDFSRLSAL